jgi:hypothetical protein
MTDTRQHENEDLFRRVIDFLWQERDGYLKSLDEKLEDAKTVFRERFRTEPAEISMAGVTPGGSMRVRIKWQDGPRMEDRVFTLRGGALRDC